MCCSTIFVVSEENKDRTLDETAGEIKSRKEDSQASESHNSGDVKLVRRNSINKPPDSEYSSIHASPETL